MTKIDTKKEQQTENKTKTKPTKTTTTAAEKKRTDKKNRNCIQGTFTKHNTE